MKCALSRLWEHTVYIRRHLPGFPAGLWDDDDDTAAFFRTSDRREVISETAIPQQQILR